MQHLFNSKFGEAVSDMPDGLHDGQGGGASCPVDGRLKYFGHPVCAPGLRMACENDDQLPGRAGALQLSNLSLGLSQDPAGVPHRGIAAIAMSGLA